MSDKISSNVLPDATSEELFNLLFSVFGYFDEPGQTVPVRDPGIEIDCPFCGKKLSMPITTPSFMVPSDNRSYFYRCHKGCYEEEKAQALEYTLVNKVYERMQN